MVTAAVMSIADNQRQSCCRLIIRVISSTDIAYNISLCVNIAAQCNTPEKKVIQTYKTNIEIRYCSVRFIYLIILLISWRQESGLIVSTLIYITFETGPPSAREVLIVNHLYWHLILSGRRWIEILLILRCSKVAGCHYRCHKCRKI